jgi:hypothetical protein
MGISYKTPFMTRPLAATTTRSAAALGASLMLFSISGAALAQTTPPTGRPQLTPAQQAKIFPEQKALSLKSHQTRIASLTDGERCISAAGNWEALKSCMQQERQANMAMHKANRSEMRSLFERNGIPFPEAREGGGKQRWGGDQGGQGQLGT